MFEGQDTIARVNQCCVLLALKCVRGGSLLKFLVDVKVAERQERANGRAQIRIEKQELAGQAKG